MNLEEMTFEEQVLIARNNGCLREVIGRLYSRFHPGIVIFSRGFVGNKETADDIANETFIGAQKYIINYNGLCKVSTWLYAIARNLSVKYLKKKEKFKTVSYNDIRFNFEELSAINQTPNVEDRMVGEDTLANAKKALMLIPPIYRVVLIGRYLDNLSQKELSQVHELPIGTVKSRINKGRELLKKSYQIVEDINDHVFCED